MKFPSYMSFRLERYFIFVVRFLNHCIYVCMFCGVLFNFVNYVFPLLCILMVMCVLFTIFCFCVVLCIVFVLFYVLFVCKCVVYYCHRVLTQLQLTNISYLITPFSLYLTKCVFENQKFVKENDVL